jgi:hypothetical protein
MTDWQPGDPLYERGDNWTSKTPMFTLKVDADGPDPSMAAASWPNPTPQRDLDRWWTSRFAEIRGTGRRP